MPAVAGLILATIAGCQSHAPANNPEASKREQTAIRVTAMKPERRTLTRTTTQPARVEAYEQTPLYVKMDGYVRAVLVDIGDPVQKDQPLAELWVPELIEEAKEKDALIEQAKAQVKQADQNIVVKQKAAASAAARISEAEASVLRAQGEFERWSAEHLRIKDLAGSGSISAKLVDETLNQMRAAEASQKEVAAKILSAQAALGECEAEVAKAEADQVAAVAKQKVAEAEAARLQALVRYTTVRSPFDGVVTERNVHTGHYVAAGGASAKNNPLFVVANNGKVRVVIDVPEVEAPLVNAGDPASIVIPALSTTPIQIKGESGPEMPKITRTSWSLLSSARTLQAEIHLENADRRLRPGMYGVVAITSEERPDVLSLPIAALVTRNGKSCCSCVENGKVVFQPVIPGLRAGDQIEIASGLKGHEWVIVANVASFEEGQAVTIGKE